MAEGMHDQYFEYTCNFMCANDKKVTESVKYCTGCLRHMCSTCLQTHQLIHKSHRLVDPVRSSKYCRNNTITSQCRKHPGKILELYCRSHDVVVCSACITDHRSCNPPVYIPDEAERLYTQRDLQRINQQALTLVADVRKVHDQAKRSNTTKEKDISAIKTYSKTLIDTIKRYEKKAIRDVEENDRFWKEILADAAGELKSVDTNLMACLSRFQSAGDNKPEQFVCLKNIQQFVSSGMDVLRQTKSVIADRNRYVVDGTISIALKRYQSLAISTSQTTASLATKRPLRRPVSKQVIEPRVIRRRTRSASPNLRKCNIKRTPSM